MIKGIFSLEQYEDLSKIVLLFCAIITLWKQSLLLKWVYFDVFSTWCSPIAIALKRCSFTIQNVDFPFD